MPDDFDLNVPATPSLTLDAPAPSLTLDPEADEKVVEEAKKPTPFQVEDTPLTPEEQQMVNDFAEKIDITNSQMVLQYGAASQKKLSDFSDNALNRVKTKDMGETGELITDLIGELQGFDATEESKGFFGFFKKQQSNIENLKTKYEKADVNVERIKSKLEDHQVTLMKDITMLDKMYQLNLVYFKELTMYILAGRKKLADVRAGSLAEATAKAQRTQLPEDAQAARDLADMCDRFEKKLHDLELTRNPDGPADPADPVERHDDGRKDPDHHHQHHSAVEKPDGACARHGAQPAGDAGRTRRDRCNQRTAAQERRNPQAGHHRYCEGVRTRRCRYRNPQTDQPGIDCHAG